MSGGTPERTETPYLRGIPLPTSGPLWAGFGVTMLFAGLVTHWMVSLVGLISAAAGFIAWGLACFPEESLEELPKGSEAVEAAPQLTRKAHAERVLLPAEMHPYGSGIRGGLIGGVAMAIVAMAWGVLREGSLWLPINLLAGVFLPSVNAEDAQHTRSFACSPIVQHTCMPTHLAQGGQGGGVYAVGPLHRLCHRDRRPILQAAGAQVAQLGQRA